MEKLELPKQVIISEIIRYDENMYLLAIQGVFCTGWEFQKSNKYIRADIHTLSELLRIENTKQSAAIEEVFLTMLTLGEPPRTDIKELTGSPLTLKRSELIIRELHCEGMEESIHSLPQLLDVLPKIKTDVLSNYLHLEKEFSKEILEQTFEAFQRMFVLIDRGYTVEEASSMTHTNNPISALIYSKIKEQVCPEEIIPTSVSKEEKIEENYIIEKLHVLKTAKLPF